MDRSRQPGLTTVRMASRPRCERRLNLPLSGWPRDERKRQTDRMIVISQTIVASMAIGAHLEKSW